MRKAARKAILIPADVNKEATLLLLPDNEDQASELINKSVGGFLELIQVPPGIAFRPGPLAGVQLGTKIEPAALWVNEDGKRLRLPKNYRATLLCETCRVGLRPGDFIKGDAVLTGDGDRYGNILTVPEHFLELFKVQAELPIRGREPAPDGLLNALVGPFASAKK